MQLLIKQIKHLNLSTLNKHLLCLFVISMSLIVSTSCGKRKPPQPPTEKVKQRVAINGSQIGNQIRLVWKMPARNTSKGSVLNINSIDVYRLAEPLNNPLTLTEDEFTARSTLIASIPVKDSDFGLKEKTYADNLQFSGQAARLRYAIRFVNSSGQKAAFSNFLIIEPSSKIASNPTSLKALISQDKISLDWTPPNTNVDGSTPANILGYNIYRSSKEELTRRLNEKLIETNNFSDEFFAFEKKYIYFVRAVSVGNNAVQVESVSSETLEITPKDTFAPNPPDAITIAAAPNNISIFFAINLEKDIAGYKIFRTTNQNSPKSDWQLLTKELLKANTYQDTKIESGKTYYYYLTAVDNFGNESQPSEVVSENAF